MEKVFSKVKLGHLTISGSILSVLDGVVEDRSLHAIGPHQFRFALGSGTFSDIESIGETLFIHGVPHVSWLKGKKVHTEKQSKVLSPFLLGLDYKQEGGILLHYKPSPSQFLQMFYQDLALEYPSGVAIVGHVLFDEVQSTYLIKPPIYGESINENQNDYWAKTHIDKQKAVCLFGVVIPEGARKKFPEEVLKRAFYQNPNETHTSKLLSHTHGALLTSSDIGQPKKVDEFLDSLAHVQVSSVRHVLTSSTIKEGVFALFPI